jgi:hypothetical protein
MPFTLPRKEFPTMASIRLGPTLADARGSIGSTVFSRNKSGMYMRARVKPINPQSPLQSLVRANLATCQAYYRDTVTAIQKAVWHSEAQGATFPNRLGDMTKISAQNIFLMINSLKLEAGLSILSDCPAGPFKAIMPTTTITVVHSAGIIITAISPVIAAGAALFWYVSDRMGTQVNYFRGPYAFRGVALSSTTVPITLVPSTGLAAGDRFFLMLRHLDANGRVSPVERKTLDLT